MEPSEKLLSSLEGSGFFQKSRTPFSNSLLDTHQNLHI
jgi:hypothetical protein